MDASRAKVALLVLCGLPGSGKTTIASKILSHVAQIGGRLVPLGAPCRVHLLTFDDWLHSELESQAFCPEIWQRSRRLALDKLIDLLERFRLDDDHDAPYTLVIADDNNYLRSMRYELFQTARDHAGAFLQLYLAASPQLAAARNRTRSGPGAVPPEVLTRMAAALEPPQAERFSWEAASLTLQVDGGLGAEVDCGRSEGQQEGEQQQRRQEGERAPPPLLQDPGTAASDAIVQLCEQLWRLWGPAPPLPPTEEDLRRRRQAGRLANASSYLHGLDLRTRRMVRQAVAAMTTCDRAATARWLNEQRRVLLAAARDAVCGAEGPEFGGGVQDGGECGRRGRGSSGVGGSGGVGGGDEVAAGGGGEGSCGGGDEGRLDAHTRGVLEELEAEFVRCVSQVVRSEGGRTEVG